MNKLKRTLALVATLALATTAFAACGDKDSSSTKATESTTAAADDSKADDSEGEAKAENKVPDTGDKLSILCWTGDDINAMIKCFAANTDYEESNVEWVKCGDNGGDACEKYATYFQGDEDVDLYIAEADWILTYINNDEVSAPIANLGFTDADFSTNYKYAFNTGVDSNGVLKGVSWQAAPGGYVYRKRLAKDYLGVETPEDMQKKVKDWDTFLETAKEVSTKSSGKTAMTATIGGMWQVFSYNRDNAWIDKDNKLVISDNEKKFMEICKTMKDNKYVTSVSQWAEDGSWYQPGQDDTTMGYFFSTWCLGKGAMLSNASGGEGGKTYGDWNICVGPSEYCWGGSWLCLSPKADNGKMAADFVKFFCSDAKTMKTYALDKGEFVNSTDAMKEIIDAKSNSNPLLGGQDQFAVLYEAANGIDLEGKITPYDATIKNDYIDEVNKYLDGETDSIDKALDAFETKVAGDLPDLNWD